MKRSCVIIGAGQAGGRAALALRDNGYTGDVHLIGSEPSVPYNRPPLSKAVLLGKKPVEKTHLAPIGQYAEKDIVLHLNCTALSFDPESKTVVCDNGKTFEFTDLILATGSYPRKLDLPGANLEGVTTFRTDQDAIQLASVLKPDSNLAIVGGGFIGLELAASARELGCNVTVLEAQDRLMTRSMPADAASDIASIHRSNGVEILTGVNIDALEGNSRVETLRYADDTTVPADHVVIGIGIIPDVKLAENAGLDVNNGILCDEYTRTSVQDIYAIGDCACTYIPRYDLHIRLESSQNADLQAVIAVKYIVGDKQAYDPVPWLWSQQYGWIIQSAGITSHADEIVTRGALKQDHVLYMAMRKQKIHGVIGIGKGAAIAKDVRLVQMLIEKEISADKRMISDPSVSLREYLNG